MKMQRKLIRITGYLFLMGFLCILSDAEASGFKFKKPSPLETKGDLFTYSTADARLPVGTDGQILSADSSTATGLRWVTLGATTTTPGGSDTQVQFNDSGAFGGDAGLTYNKTTNVLTITSGEITAPGAGANSEKFGASATSAGASSVAVGKSATASAGSTVALGESATASAILAIGIGKSVTAGGIGNEISIGASSTSTSGGIAIGGGANNAFDSIAIGENADPTDNNQAIIGGGDDIIANVYFGQGVTATTPTGVSATTTLTTTGGSGTNKAAPALAIAGGKSTGTGDPGDVEIYVAERSASGSTLNSLVRVVTWDAASTPVGRMSLRVPLSSDSGGTGNHTYTKGDILVATGTDLAKLTVGATNGMVLSVDSSTSTGLRWGFAGGGGGGTPGGASSNIQYNSSGTFAGAALITTDGTRVAVGPGTSTKISVDVAGSFRNVPVQLVDGASISLDLARSNFFWVQLGGNRTLVNPSNGAFGQRIILMVSQDGAGSRKLTFGSSYKFGTDVPSYDASTTASTKDYIAMIFNGVSLDIVGVSKGYR